MDCASQLMLRIEMRRRMLRGCLGLRECMCSLWATCLRTGAGFFFPRRDCVNWWNCYWTSRTSSMLEEFLQGGDEGWGENGFLRRRLTGMSHEVLVLTVVPMRVPWKTSTCFRLMAKPVLVVELGWSHPSSSPCRLAFLLNYHILVEIILLFEFKWTNIN